MSVIYSAGQYDDAFTPKRLGNWESTAKESYPFNKPSSKYSSFPKIISDSRGHLLPWVPRGPKTSPWGLLNFHLRSRYHHHHSRTVLMSGPGKQPSNNSIQKRLKKLPKFRPRQHDPGPPPDLLLQYLQHLRLPIIWIIGPYTRKTFQKRRTFAKQLATNLNFGYVSLDDKVQEWKDRQQICTCSVSPAVQTTGPPPSPPTGPLHSLASTSIAPSKLPTSVPPFISPNIPTPPQTPHAASANAYLLSILESQRITFDTAIPLERQKLLELYKFAMAECLPCEGFVMDSMPFDLVEGLQFEKIFYPAALAIYFTEGVPQKIKKLKPKDRRVTACASSASSYCNSKNGMMTSVEYLEHRNYGKRPLENVYLKPKSYRRLGVFNLAEGDKLCKTFGGKTIRIINAEDVESDTMEFLNELVKKNLLRYQDILEGKCKLDFGMGGGLLPAVVSQESFVRPPPPRTSYTRSNFISEEEEKAMELKEDQEASGSTEVSDRNMPPALVTAHQSDTSLFTLPNIFKTGSESESSLASSARTGREETVSVFEEDSTPVLREEMKSDKTKTPPVAYGYQEDGSGDNFQVAAGELISKKERCTKPETPRRKSAELWDRIVRLESKVAQLRPQEEEEDDFEDDPQELEAEVLPPPTAYQEEDDEEVDNSRQKVIRMIRESEEDTEIYTQAIRNAIRSVSPPAPEEYQYAPPYQYRQSEVEYDYGASGDYCGPPPNEQQQQYGYQQQGQQQAKKMGNRKYPPNHTNNSNNYAEDPFYDN